MTKFNKTMTGFEIIQNLKFCGCGNPEDGYTALRDTLQTLDSGKATEEEWKTRCERVKTWREKIGENNAALLLYLLNAADLLEHGGSVGGSWLSEKGKLALDFLTKSMVHNGGWYNTAGEKIGWGDLAGTDFRRIQSSLKEGECFVILGESDSFWKFVTQIGMTGDLSKVNPTELNPGVEYVAEKARWIITNPTIYCVDAYNGDNTEDGVEYKTIERDKVAALLASGK